MVYDTLFGLGRSMSSVTEGAMDPEIAGITLDSVEECAGDPFEFATAIMYENEMAMNNLDMAVMCCEYAYLKENGTEMVYEAGVLKNFFDSAKKKVKEWWEKIVKFFKKVFNYVANFVRTDEQFVSKYSALAKKAGTVKGLKLKGYVYDTGLPKKMLDKVKSSISGVKDMSALSSDWNTDDSVDNKMDGIRGEICREGNKSASATITASEFSKELNKALKGGTDEKEDISVFDCSKAIDEIKAAKQTKKDLQELFDACKALANQATNNLSVVESNAKKAEKEDPNSDDKKNASKAAHNAVQYVSALLSVATMVNNQGAKMITAANRQNRAFTVKALSKYSKDQGIQKAGKLNESAYEDVFSAFGM